VAEFRGGMLTVWAGTQTPHRLRSGLAQILRLPESAVRVIAPDVGGGFGCKISFHADEALCAWAAMRTGRPVKLVLTRREDFLATTQGRGQINDVEAAVARDGTVLALRARTFADLGAYLEILTPYAGMLTGRLLTGPYRIPAARYELTSVFTNAMATAPYRGAGRPEATYLLERTMDAIARSCGLDPAEVRRRNLIRPEEFPYRAPSGLVYDSGQYEAALDRALAMVDYKRFRDLQRRARDDGRHLGIGFSTFVEPARAGPRRVGGQGARQGAADRGRAPRGRRRRHRRRPRPVRGAWRAGSGHDARRRRGGRLVGQGASRVHGAGARGHHRMGSAELHLSLGHAHRRGGRPSRVRRRPPPPARVRVLRAART